MFKLIIPGLPILEYLNTPLYFGKLKYYILSLVIYILTVDFYLAVYAFVYMTIIFGGVRVKPQQIHRWLVLMAIGFLLWLAFPVILGQLFHQEYPSKFSFYLREPSFLAEYWALVLLTWKFSNVKFLNALLSSLFLYYFSDSETIFLYFFLIYVFAALKPYRYTNFAVYFIVRALVIVGIYLILVPLSFQQGSWRILSNLVALVDTTAFSPGYEDVQRGMTLLGMPWINSVFSLGPIIYSKMGAVLGGLFLIAGEYRIFRVVRSEPDGGIWYFGTLIGVWLAPKWLVVAAFRLI